MPSHFCFVGMLLYHWTSNTFIPSIFNCLLLILNQWLGNFQIGFENISTCCHILSWISSPEKNIHSFWICRSEKNSSFIFIFPEGFLIKAFDLKHEVFFSNFDMNGSLLQLFLIYSISMWLDCGWILYSEVITRPHFTTFQLWGHSP